MREPYQTLLGQYWNHWFLWAFLAGDVPDFAGIAASDGALSLSDGELLMLHVAMAFYNGDRTARIADLGRLDDANRRRVAEAIYMAMDAHHGR